MSESIPRHQPHWRKDLFTPSEELVTARILSEFADADRPMDDATFREGSAEDLPSRRRLPGTIVLPEQYDSPVNRTLLQKLGKVFYNIWLFAKKHPFYTAGFILGLGLLALSAPLLVSVLSNQLGISILKAQVAVGLVTVGMAFYYAVFLINMARRHAFKDELEAAIDRHQKLGEQILKLLSEEQLKKSAEKLEAKARDLERENLKQARDTRAKIEEIQSQILDLKEAQENVRAAQQKLKPSITKGFSKEIPEAIQLHCISAYDQAQEALKEGIALAAHPELLPLEEQEIFGEEITIPSAATAQMVKNQGYLSKLTKALVHLPGDLKTFIKNNPGSTVLIFTGLFLTIAAGVGLYFWLEGVTEVYLIGSLSLSTLLPLTMYGLSLMYEGYNSSTINKLTASLEAEKEKIKKVVEEFNQKKMQLKRVKASAKLSLEQFQEEWKAFHTKEMDYLEEQLQEKELSINRNMHLSRVVDECKNAYIELLEFLLGEKIPQEEVAELVRQPLNGATIAGQAAKNA